MAKQGRPARTQPPCGQIDIPAVWKRIEAGIRQLSPDLAANLAPGATEKEIAAFEKATKQTLPDEVRQHFLCHNGQRGSRRSIPAWRRSWIFKGLEFMSLKQALTAWRMWREFDDDEDLQEGCRDVGNSTPKDAIRLGYTDPNWLPLINISQGIDLMGVDLNPGPKGVSGQVINFGRNEDYKRVFAWSWGWFLHELASELEDGNIGLQTDEDYPELAHKHWPHGMLCNAPDSWFKARLGQQRPLGQLAVEALKACRADTTVLGMARSIASGQTFDQLPILADALEDAGCTNADILRHCREPGDHGCSCWVVDSILGKR